MAEQDGGAGKGEQRQRVAEPPGQPVLDDIGDMAAACGDAGYGSDMIGFERVLHAQQKPQPQNSEHTPPALSLIGQYQSKAFVGSTLHRTGSASTPSSGIWAALGRLPASRWFELAKKAHTGTIRNASALSPASSSHGVTIYDKIRNPRRRGGPRRHARRPRYGAGSHLQSRLLCAILSKRQLPEHGTWKPLYRGAIRAKSTRIRCTGTKPIGIARGKTATTAGTTIAASRPGDVAAGVVGGAVGTAAAIATAPIAGEDYARRNGFVCIPGTWFRGEDGLMHICQ